MNWNLPRLLTVSVFGFPLNMARADTRVYDFNGPNLPSMFTLSSSSANMSAALSGTSLKLIKTAGLSSGVIEIQSTTYLTGDFDIVGEILRGAGDCSKGMMVRSESSNATQNLYCTSSQRLVVSSHSQTGGFVSATGHPSTAAMKMRLQRVGSTISSIVDKGTGAGWQTVYSRTDTLFAQPMQVTLFSVMEVGSTAADTFEIEKLTMEFSGLGKSIPLPAMDVRPGVEMILPTRALNRYQIQVSSALENTPWTDLGIPIQGTGQNVLIYDFTQGLPNRFYRATLTD